MPRLLSRALLVLGGATAATAAAWLISSATASADTLPSVPAVPSIASTHTATVNAPFQTGLSDAVSTVADPVTNAGSGAVDAVTEPSQHAVLPLPADLPAMPSTAPAGLDQLTTGLRDTVGQLDTQLPGRADLPGQLIAHLGSTAGAPVAPATQDQPTVPVARSVSTQAVPVASGKHATRLGGTAGNTSGQHGATGGPRAPAAPYGSPFPPLTFPAVPGNGGGSGSGSAAPAGLGLTAGNSYPFIPQLRVLDVRTPASVPASVMPGKQPGVTPD